MQQKLMGGRGKLHSSVASPNHDQQEMDVARLFIDNSVAQLDAEAATGIKLEDQARGLQQNQMATIVTVEHMMKRKYDESRTDDNSVEIGSVLDSPSVALHGNGPRLGALELLAMSRKLNSGSDSSKSIAQFGKQVLDGIQSGPFQGSAQASAEQSVEGRKEGREPLHIDLDMYMNSEPPLNGTVKLPSNMNEIRQETQRMQLKIKEERKRVKP